MSNFAAITQATYAPSSKTTRPHRRPHRDFVCKLRATMMDFKTLTNRWSHAAPQHARRLYTLMPALNDRSMSRHEAFYGDNLPLKHLHKSNGKAGKTYT